MDFEQLQKKIGVQNKTDWYQTDDGGWIHTSAKVERNIRVYKNAIIYGGEIRGGVIHGGVIRGGVIRGGIIHGGVVHGGVIRGGVVHGGVIRGGIIHGGIIYGGIIHGGVIRGGVIHGGVVHGGELHGGELHGGKWKKAPLQIQGSRDFFNVSDEDKITIGCITTDFNNWIENYKEIGEKHNYTIDEIIEYKNYIDLAVKRYKK